MSITDRLSRLDAHVRATRPRCSTCKDWPELPVVFEYDANDRAAAPHPMDGHTCCPTCGWAPTYILRVVYESAEPVAA